MRIPAATIALVCLTSPLFSADKLTFDDRVELTRGLMAEYATVKQFLPRSKKALPFDSTGTWDKKQWQEIGHEYGPAARVGDLVQITKISIEDDRIVLQINGGFKGGRHWYQNVEIGGDVGMAPISQGDANAPGGTTIAVLFHKPLTSGIKSAEIKKMLAPVLDFDKRSPTQLFSETLTPEMQKAVKEKRAIVGMTREEVVMAMGRPDHKSRETVDGMETEDWVFGKPPGKIVFVTFAGSKVSKVKEEYAGLGTVAPDPKLPRQ